jgi:hypothetical protein
LQKFCDERGGTVVVMVVVGRRRAWFVL